MRFDRKGNSIGNTLTKFPALILILLVISAYIVVSIFVLRDKLVSYSLVDDFLDDYIIYEDKVVTVSEVFGIFCSYNKFDQESNRAKFNELLVEHFNLKYGYGNYFAFVHSFGIDKRVYFWSDPIEGYTDSDGDLNFIDGTDYRSKFFEFFDKKSESVEIRNGVNIASSCGIDNFLYVREDQ